MDLTKDSGLAQIPSQTSQYPLLRRPASGYSLSTQDTTIPPTRDGLVSLYENRAECDDIGLVDLDSRRSTTGAQQTRDDGRKEMTPTDEPPPAKKGFRFWLVIAALSMAIFMCALESVIVSTALPTVVAKLEMGSDFVWVTSVNFLTSAVVAPPLGQLADLFGRRWLATSVVFIFGLGGAISGAAMNGTMLIIGRAIQGFGAGGVAVVSQIIVADLVPLRDRGLYSAILLVSYFIGGLLGPLLGGVLVQGNGDSWRWVFWLPVIPSAISLVLLFLFLKAKVKKDDGMSFLGKLKRIDYLGNLLVIVSTVSLLLALTYGGTKFEWLSPQIIVSLVIGIAGLVLFAVVEWACAGTAIMPEPLMPLRLLNHRTGSIIAVNNFIVSMLGNWTPFFLPVYFQAVKLSTPALSGIQILPMIIGGIPSAMVGVVLVSKLGKYKFLHLIGFALAAAGLALLSILTRNSPDVAWVMIEILASIGTGAITSTLLPAFQAGVPETDQAVATSTFYFLRGLANIWSFTIPATILNNRFEALSWRIPDDTVRSEMSNGRAYEHATKAFLTSLPENVMHATIEVFTESLQLVWWIAAGCAGLAFVLAVFEKNIPLRTKLETDYGLQEDGKGSDDTNRGASI